MIHSLGSKQEAKCKKNSGSLHKILYNFLRRLIVYYFRVLLLVQWGKCGPNVLD